MKNLVKFSFLIVPLLVLWAAPSLFGQGSGVTGAIYGFVSDPTGAAIAGASVKVTNVGTGASFTAGTTSDGFYTVRFLVAGTYRVEVSQSGFKTLTVQNVLVQAASTATVDAKLEMGAVAQSVTVTATTSMLEMQRADTGATVEHVLIDETPSNAGTATQVYYDTPGVQNVKTSRGFSAGGLNADTEFSVNGSAANVNQEGWVGSPNNEVVDGVSARNTFAFPNGAYLDFNPTPNLTDELKVVSLPFSAEYGHTIGGVVIVTTKSGTNRWHGRGSEANVPAGLRANTFTNNYTVPRVNRSPGSMNHEVGALGGAIKKNKLFVYGVLENWYSTANGSPLAGSVPTAAMRQGDFTQSYYNSGGNALVESLSDPFSCATYNASGVCTARYPIGTTDPRLSTTANVIPYSAWSPVAKALFPTGNAQKYIPLPLNPGLAIGSTGKYLAMTNNYVQQLGAPSSDRFWMGRMDYNLDPSNRLMLRYLHTFYVSWDPPYYPDLRMQAVDANFPYIRQGDSGAIEYTHTLSPTSIMSFTLGFYRFNNYGEDAYRRLLGPGDLGFSPTFVSESPHAVPEIYNAGGGYQGGTAWTGIGTPAGTYGPDQTFQVYGLWSKSIGRHIIKVGGETVNERGYSENGGNTAGNWTFQVEPTAPVPGATAQLGQGDAFASFLLGVGTGSIDRNVEYARQAWTAGVYVQDDIKVSHRLTINAGVRWDWSGAPTDRYNAISGTFNMSAASPIAAAAKAAAGASNCAACINGLVGGETFPAVGGSSRSPYDSTFRDFQPRLGFAYQVGQKTILRGGWGLFVSQFQYDPGATGFSVTTTNSQYDPTYMPLNLLANPFPNGLVSATGSSLGLSTALGGSITFTDPHARPQHGQMFNFNVQRLLSPNTVLTVGYVYNHGTRLPVNHNINHMTYSQLIACQQNTTACLTPVTNPFYGIAPAGTTLGSSKTLAAYLFYNPYPQFSSVTENYSPLGDSEYHALQVQLVRHFSHGVSLNMGYTNSKWEGHNFFANSVDPKPQKDIDCFDRPQMFNFNWVYEIPIGRGHYLGGNMPRFANAILGGWQHNAVFYIWEGTPFDYFGNNAEPLPGVSVYNSPRSTDHWVNPAAFEVPTYPAQFPYVTWSLIDSRIRVPRYRQMDQSLQKNFKIKERVTAMLRISFWNSFNSTAFDSCGINSNVNNRANSNFGRITPVCGYSNNPRSGTLEGRVDF